MSERAAQEPATKRPTLVSRRALLGGAAAGVVATGLEWMSLRGHFDHRYAPSAAASAKKRFDAALRSAAAGKSGVIHVGHSTHLLTLDGMRLLTDPWFYDPAFGALSHDVTPAVPPSELGDLDAVLVTHDHADHADLRAIDEMDKRAAMLVATPALAARVRALGFTDVAVLAPWETREIGKVRVTAVPALHDVYEIGFVVEGRDRIVYFAGDTQLHPDLPAIAERFRPDFAILPVDGTRLAGSSMRAMTPEDAVEATRMLGTPAVMPSHAEARFTDPLAGSLLASTVLNARDRFVERMAAELPGVRCHVPSSGEFVPF